ncbi:hypothetical protein AB0P21_28615 [Kribbella sp. NPDC056861]|uniref:hypothetical protein n=1 Tax=Kribbella sp. NPDC056861 TaxID=3154857 RepID=UPI00343278AA
MTIDPLAKILSSAEAVLFDFDGPICSVFDGYPAPRSLVNSWSWRTSFAATFRMPWSTPPAHMNYSWLRLTI